MSLGERRASTMWPIRGTEYYSATNRKGSPKRRYRADAPGSLLLSERSQSKGRANLQQKVD